MKKLRNLIAVMAAMTMALAFTGCGDDDDDDSGAPNPNPQPNLVGPANEAELTQQNKIYNLTGASGGPATLRFPSAGNYEFTQNNVTQTGTITATQGANRNTWNVVLTPAGGQAGALTGTARLDFAQANSGTWTFTPADGSQAESGAFNITGPIVDPTNGNTDGGQNGLPATLEGRTLQLSYPTAGGEKFEFISATAVRYENGANAGTYVYDQANRRVDVTLDSGATYQITLTPPNTASVFYKANPNDAGVTDPATYTLTQ
jgi:hypothetical protein